MSYGLRSIAFIAELIHPPVKHDPQGLRELHGAFFGNAECSYRDFRIVPGGAQYSNGTTGTPGSPVSMVSVLADRVQMREEQTGVSKDDFSRRLRVLSESVLANTSVNLFMVQQFAIRSVLNPQSSSDSLAFMVQTVFGFDQRLMASFPTLPNLAGMRLQFPPSGEDQAVYNVRLESFAQDNRSLFVENVGTYGRPIQAAALDDLTERFEATYGFLQDHLLDFVSQFDGEDA